VNWKEVEKRPEPAPEKPDGEFTDLFGRPPQGNSAPGPLPATASIERFAPSVVQVDEFARVIASRPASSQPKAPLVVNEPESTAAQKKPSPTILFVVIAAILILSGCAIYFFVIRK
jgi:hypothetical protein